jgi:asparagine synthase (glutamine-hydrolysing)
MCGIAGVFDPTGMTSDPEGLLRSMGQRIAHRGPDDHGEWWSPLLNFGLAHRRLSILDVTQAGHQPMVSRCGNWVIAFNGEVYNFETLRAELAQKVEVSWRGHSDTEVVLECIAADGFEEAISKFSGMFAIAALDIRNRRLWLATDHAGKKPLYFGWLGNKFCFASELKALRVVDAPIDIDRSSVALFMRYGYIAAPHTIYRGIQKLAQGRCVSVCLSPNSIGQPIKQSQYWSIAAVANQGMALPRSARPSPAGLEDVLESAVRRRLVSDVPVGAFLSGGIDSSVVTALMARNSTGRISTFSIGFDDPALDESKYARAVAEHLGTDHTTYIVSDADMLAVVPKLPWMYDEPFADSSQIPTYLVSQLARSRVKVALSGDGGDELFGGYARYGEALRVWKMLQRVPFPMRQVASVVLARCAPMIALGDSKFGLSSRTSPRIVRAALRSPAGVAEVLSSQAFQDLYRRMVSSWSVPPVCLQADDAIYPDPLCDIGVDINAVGAEAWMMAADFQTYLPGDILVKVDRASMAQSLEIRCPLLDRDVVSFAWSLDMEHRISPPRLKVALVDLARTLVPREVIDRPKMGFGVPLARWLRGPLREWMLDSLSHSRIASAGLLDPKAVALSVSRLMSGRDEEQPRVWTALMLSEWWAAERQNH